MVQPVAVEEVVGDVLDELKLKPGRVQLELGETRPVSADPALLQRVLVNLLANALRYSPQDAPPVIASSEFGDRVQLRVIDVGPGVPEDRREEMFVPFQRLGDTDNTAGVGLGLALAKGFVEGMGGTLEAEDTPGGGLTMVVELEAT
jgi:two-component system sensor histidine kinase KdpD